MPHLALALRLNSSLKSLSIALNGLGTKGAAMLCRSLSRDETAIEELNLYGNAIGDEGLSCVLYAFGRLKALDIGRNEITSAGVSRLTESALVDLPLASLSLAENTVGETGCAAVAPLLASGKSLARLSLSNCGVNDEGVKMLCLALQRNRVLFDVDLSANSLKSVGITSVSDMLGANLTLKAVNVGWNNAVFSDEESAAMFSHAVRERLIGLDSNHARSSYPM